MVIVEKLKSRWGTLALLGALAALGAYEWKSAKQLAAPAAHAAPRPSLPVVLAEGRVATYPGRKLTVGAEIAGRVSRVFAEERQAVKLGEPLAEIDVAEQKAALVEANARVKEVETELAFQESELVRAERLLAGHAVAEVARDRTRLDRDAAKARRESLRASAARLATVLAKAKAVAPIDGVILERHAEAGEMVSPGAPLYTVADLGRLRVEAEVGEFDAPRVVLGAKARVRAEGHEGRVFEATVEEIPDRVVARGQKPLDPSRPVDTRVLLVKLALSDASGLKLGQRVEVEIPRAEPER